MRQELSSGHFERKKRTHLTAVARAALFEHAAAPGQARAAPVEHSAAPEQTRAALFEYSAAPGPARAVISSNLRLRGGLTQPFRPISSHLRLRARRERPYAANSGISRARQARAAEALERARPRPEANFMNRYIYVFIHLCIDLHT